MLHGTKSGLLSKWTKHGTMITPNITVLEDEEKKRSGPYKMYIDSLGDVFDHCL